ncbi:protein alp1-like [Plakobranchus ocellatus]|uniref:Protein alp1-like n=1 Tax=Plakobranchus ocellatus TaxID=259542 RepID=A0AAV3ZDE1_9GAST|nr:protein alp1-like [Plakobranchus ocellatus]
MHIQTPPKSESNFYNYKQFFSIVLQGVVDSDLKFIAVEVGAYGKESDGGICSRSDTKSYFEENVMGLPDLAPLPDSPASASFPYFLIGDAAYHLNPFLITLFSGPMTQQRQILYNCRHSRVRKCIECALAFWQQN